MTPTATFSFCQAESPIKPVSETPLADAFIQDRKTIYDWNDVDEVLDEYDAHLRAQEVVLHEMARCLRNHPCSAGVKEALDAYTALLPKEDA